LTLELTDAQLRKLAGDRAFARGIYYAERGRVKLAETDPLVLRAVVTGSQRYRVQIEGPEDQLVWRCDCPAADDGSFCKHLVALAIVARGAPPSAGRDAPEGDLRVFLRAQPAERLADWLAELAEADDAIAKRLRLRQAESDPQATE
jgi:uncharacterized Zn finger protein